MAPSERSRTADHLHINGLNTFLGASLLPLSEGNKMHFLTRLKQEIAKQEIH